MTSPMTAATFVDLTQRLYTWPPAATIGTQREPPIGSLNVKNK